MKIPKLFVLAAVLFFAAFTAVFASGNKEAPQAQVQTSGSQYLSPNGDGVMDTGSQTFSVTLKVKSDKGYVPSYAIAISNDSGTVVKTISETQQSEINWFIQIFTGYKQFTLNKTITWDGKNDAGTVVPDGTYHTKLTVTDSSNNTVSIPLADFVVDTTPPSVTISAGAGMLFSPNGDGNLDTFPITQQNGTVEHLWTGTFTDSSGKAVRTYTWQDQAPPSFAWDGKDDSGNVAPDGTYTYGISSTDLAGNKSSVNQITGIVLNTEATPVSVTLSNPAFSPNGDGVKDTTTAMLSASATQAVVSWTLGLTDASGNVVRQTGGDGPFPAKVDFDGNDAQGKVLPDGTYTVAFDVKFGNGNDQKATAPVVINTTPPHVVLSVDNPYFSPNGDGVKDTTTASISVNSPGPVDTWSLALANAAGTPVAAVTDSGTPPATVPFDGKNASGATLPDGAYTATLSVTMADGTKGSASTPITIDTVPPTVQVTPSSPLFTPNSNDSRNHETVTINANEPVTWTGTLSNAAGQTLMTTSEPMSLQTVELDKSVPQVASAAEGVYTLNLTFTDRAGNSAKAKPVMITLLQHAVNMAITTDKGFSPNGDGVEDTLGVQLSNSGETPSKWDIAVVDANGNAVADYAGTGALPANVSWDGKTGNGGTGPVAPEGTYSARLTATLSSGVPVTIPSNSFVLDVTPPTVSAAATPQAFVVDGKGLDGGASGSVTVSDASSIAKWSADILAPDGSTVKSYGGAGNPSQQFTWTGTLPIPGPVPTQLAAYGYAVRLSATDIAGNATTKTFNIPIDVIAKKRDDGRLQLLVPNMLFGPYKYTLDSRSAQQGKQNAQTIQTVVALMNRYPSYTLEVDGYSMEIYKQGTSAYDREQAIIVPLADNRAQTVMKALIDAGLDASRITAVGMGAKDPLVDPLNVNQRYLNRRVELMLIPPGGSGN